MSKKAGFTLPVFLKSHGPCLRQGGVVSVTMKTKCRLKVLVWAAAGLLAASLVMADTGWADNHQDADDRVDWSGIYAGVHVGGAGSNVDWDVNIGNAPRDSLSYDAGGLIAGGHLGVQRQFENIVFGVEASVTVTDLDDREPSNLGPTVSFSTETDTIATVTGRLGYALDRFLPYVKAGYAGADIATDGRVVGLFPDTFSLRDWEHGWTVGTGVEYMLTENLVIGVEYNYIDFGETDRSGTTDIGGFAFRISDVDKQIHSLSGRVSIKFDWLSGR